MLPPLPLEMNNHPTVDLLRGTLVTCYLTTCYSLINSVQRGKDNKTSLAEDTLGLGWEALTENLHTSFVNSVDRGKGKRMDRGKDKEKGKQKRRRGRNIEKMNM